MTQEGKFVPASLILQQLHDQAPAGPVTLQWLMGRLREQSFGMIILILAIAAAAPGVSILAGTPAAGSVLPDDNRVFRNQISAVDRHARIAHATRRRRYGTRHSNSKIPRKSDLSALCDPARNDTARRRHDYICAHDSVAASAITAQQHRPRDLHRVHFADLCRTRRFTPYPGAFAGVPFSRFRNWHNLATDPQCKNQLGCELSEARRSHSMLHGGRTFVAEHRRLPCRTKLIAFLYWVFRCVSRY